MKNKKQEGKAVWNGRWYLAFLMLVLTACGNRAERMEAYFRADSLNQEAYSVRYRNLVASEQAAQEAFHLAKRNSSQRAEALNNLGFCAFMRMDFERASNLFKQALEEGDNEIERLIADVGMMKICQRTAMNKEFYDYRNSAFRRMKRIREDEKQISDTRLKLRLNYAVSEFYIVSGIYFYYLQQHDESLRAIDSVDVNTIRNDTAQWLYYVYMRGSGDMYEAPTHEKLLAGELSYLVSCLMVSRERGYIYFEANALQALAELLNFRQNRETLAESSPGLLRMINDKGLPLDSLPLSFARKALSLFKRYDDWYQISGTYRTLATYYNYTGCPEKALPNLDTALHYVNLHHEKYYHCTDTLDRLRTYIPGAGRSIELKWIADEGIKTVPEWILRLREQLSRTYSAMDMKPESDYNRNIYLDLLDYTRQDKLVESRYMALERESKQLNALLFLVVLGVCILILLFVFFNWRWKRRNSIYLSTLKQVFELCRKIISSVPASASDMDEVVCAIRQTVKDDFSRIFGAVDIQIWLKNAETGILPEDISFELPEKTTGFVFDLVSPEKGLIGRMWMALSRPFHKEEKALLQLVSPYLAWALENGANLVSLDNERRRVEKEQYIHQQHWVESKKENVVKKACLSIVTGILPYIDRIVNEVHKLKSAPYARQEQIKRGKYAYIDELITRINEYNDILALWIKMRQGTVSLNIENFELNELFDIVAKGKRSFEMKRQIFIVHATKAIVKADRALTLFMINTLAENARKYTPEGGRVELEASETPDYVEISVSDTGMGLSEKDIRCILDEKVYDSGAIGMDTAADTESLRHQKGHGFGLMNCKGIIEKYRKTNALFNVCRFGIQSTPGKGSRFYFRLPKGVKRVLVYIGLICFILGGNSCRKQSVASASVESQQVASYDSLLAIANDYANLVYECNVNGYYNDALEYADSVLHYLNIHYLRYSGHDTPLLSLYRDDYQIGEQEWLDKQFDTDYYILLDVRNEAAVAALAVKDFYTYYYNNQAYTVLYKQLSKDRTLEAYCVQMRQSANNKLIALVLLILLVFVCLIGYYWLYWRHRLRYRYNMEQVFVINQAIFASVRLTDEGNIVPDVLLKRLADELNELFPIANLGLAFFDEETSVLHWHFRQENETDEVRNLMQHSFDKQELMRSEASGWIALPLQVRIGGEIHYTGVFALQIRRRKINEEDILLSELVVDYLAAVLYNAVIRVRQKYNDIELAQDDARRALYEENLLHVQNMVLDNCLSTIKHETVYYPNRIKQIIDRLNINEVKSESDEREQLQTVDELVNYYKDIFGLLSSCAARQLEEITFRRTEIRSEDVEEKLCRYFRKMSRRLMFTLELESHIPSGLIISGDVVLLDFLFENLINEAVRYPEAGRLLVSAASDNGFVKFCFTDMRRSYTQEELNTWFYPSLARMYAGNCNELVGTEFLICKQIIRDYDEYDGKRGCRINACPETGGGYTVWFTVPEKKR